MRVLTRLPADLRGRLEALDPAAGGDPAPRPMLDDVLARAIAAPDEGSGTVLDLREIAHEPPRGSRRTWLAVAAVVAVTLVVGLAVGFGAAHRNRTAATPDTGPRPTSTSSELALYGRTWLDSTASSTIVFGPNSAYISTVDGCDAETRALTVRGNHVQLGASIGPGTACPSPTPPPPGDPGYAAYVRREDALRFFQLVVDSHPAWSVSDGRLTLTTPAGASIDLAASGSPSVAPVPAPGDGTGRCVDRVFAGTVSYGDGMERFRPPPPHVRPTVTAAQALVAFAAAGGRSGTRSPEVCLAVETDGSQPKVPSGHVVWFVRFQGVRTFPVGAGSPSGASVVPDRGQVQDVFGAVDIDSGVVDYIDDAAPDS